MRRVTPTSEQQFNQSTSECVSRLDAKVTPMVLQTHLVFCMRFAFDQSNLPHHNTYLGPSLA